MNIFTFKDTRQGIHINPSKVVVKRGLNKLSSEGRFEYRNAPAEFLSVREAIDRMARGPVIESSKRSGDPVLIYIV